MKTTKVGLVRCKDGRWYIEGYGVVWEKDLIKALKELIVEEECTGF
ncbi:MAG: hypothetical protein OEY30_01895 [Candidatus Bathyarchaeota archaeon]|nr:hypothetical protein [Candidatus Bathyarchaeota archaeon]